MFPATEAKSEIHFHEISRKSGERIHHQKVAESDGKPVDKDEVVKGYEYSKGEYVQIEPEEIANLRIPSRQTVDLQQFVDLDDLDPAFFEKPYFLVPDGKAQSEAFAVVRKALEETHKAGLGKIALSGREHVVAIAVPPDHKLNGLMAYTLRYASELRKPAEYFDGVKTAEVDAEGLSLAKELISRKASKFDPAKFTDEYEGALRELVEAKLKHQPLPVEEKPAARGKVINLMDALRRSVKDSGEDKPTEKRGKEASGAAKAQGGKHGISLIKKNGKDAVKRRKSA